LFNIYVIVVPVIPVFAALAENVLPAADVAYTCIEFVGNTTAYPSCCVPLL
jgi:hypothetical protein